MRQPSESGKLAKNSTQATPAFDKLTKAQLIELLQGDIKSPISPAELYRAAVSIVAKWCNDEKYFAKKICKVKNYAYLCFAKEPDFGHNKVIRTLFERVPVALLLPQSWFFGENKRDTLSFCIY